MSKVEEIEQVIEQLAPTDFEELAAWMARRGAELGRGRGTSIAIRDHRAFLNSYSAEDEGLYDDAQGR